MALVTPNGQLTTLQNLWNAAFYNNAALRLFQNNHVPAVGDTIANYTEATFAGYASIALGAPPAAVFAVDRSSKTWPAETFTATGALQTVFGYYVTDAAGATLLWAEAAIGGSVNMAAGVSYTITPVHSLKQF